MTEAFVDMVQHVCGAREATAVDVQSVADTEDSLKAMVGNYIDRRGDVTPPVRSAMVQKLDMSVVSRRYEQEIQAPIKGALCGDLIEALLIQVQAMKHVRHTHSHTHSPIPHAPFHPHPTPGRPVWHAHRERHRE